MQMRLTGRSAAMKNGACTGLGIYKHCPKCGELYGFAKFSALVDNMPDDWPRIG